jgi:hypothetical protein
LNTERYNLPKDYYATYLQKLNSYTVEDINKTAADLIQPDKMYITAVGNGAEIKDKLAQFGEVEMFNNMGDPAKEIEMADASMTAEKVLENYISAIGGEDAASAIKSAKVSMAADIGGNSLVIDMVFDDQNMRYGQKTSVMGNVMQSTTMMDGKGFVSAQDQTMEMSDEQYEEGKMSSLFLPELYYVDLGYTLTLDGVKDVDGTPAYKVIIANPSGAKMANYYAVESGLKIKNENEKAGDTYYKDYQEKNGVLIPMGWMIKSPALPVPIDAKITSLELNPSLTEADFK